MSSICWWGDTWLGELEDPTNDRHYKKGLSANHKTLYFVKSIIAK